MALLCAHAERMSLSHRRRLPLVLGDRSFDPRTPTPTPTATPTPLPTPTPRPKLLFRSRPDACYSVHGWVPSDCRIRSDSEDGQLYVQHVDPSHSEFGVFDAQECDRQTTLYGQRNNVLKGMAFSPNGEQVAILYHNWTWCKLNSIWLFDDLLGTPTRRVISFCEADGGDYRHYMVYLNADYLALSISGSESDALVLGIEDSALCTLAEWRANRRACPATTSLGL
jgi:hypothetical protein